MPRVGRHPAQPGAWLFSFPALPSRRRHAGDHDGAVHVVTRPWPAIPMPLYHRAATVPHPDRLDSRRHARGKRWRSCAISSKPARWG